MPIDVSIIIINFNTELFTTKCIESIYQHSGEISFEIILVDNASSEVDPEVFIEKFPSITLIKSPLNLGFAKGNNLGIDYATGRYILLLNSDTVLQNNTVCILLNFLQKNKKVAAVSGRLEFPDGRLQHNCQRFPSVSALLFELFRLQKLLPKTGERVLQGPFFKYDRIIFPDWIWGTCFMFRKELLQKLPGQKLADDFFMYGEDMQWCMEFRKLGYKVAFLPETRIIHIMGASNADKLKLMKEHHHRFMHMYYPKWKISLIGILNRLLRLR